MARLLGLRAGRLVLVGLVVSFLSFLLLDLVPGDPVLRLVGFNAAPEVQAEVRAELGLDDPLAVRYVDWVADAARGDFGQSYLNETSTSELIRSALPKTVELLVLSQLIAIGIAVPLAIRSARRPDGIVDRLTSALSFGFFALPAFVLGVYLVALFAVRLGWLPSIAVDTPGLNEDPVENLRQMALPAFTLGINLVAVYLRVLRADIIAVLRDDFVLMARARGFSERRVLWRHALRPASLTLITTVGLNTAGLIGGSVVIESLFAIQGMGRLLLTSIFNEDYQVVQALVLLFSLGYVVVNVLTDVLYAVVDPRIRT